MNNAINDFKTIFSKEKKILEKQKKINEKLEKIYDKKSKIAFNLHKMFIKNNKNNFDISKMYYYIHIENDHSFLVEEVRYKKTSKEMVEFKHNSPHRANLNVYLYLDVKKDDYNSNSSLIDAQQFQSLSQEFKVTIRT